MKNINKELLENIISMRVFFEGKIIDEEGIKDLREDEKVKVIFNVIKNDQFKIHNNGELKAIIPVKELIIYMNLGVKITI